MANSSLSRADTWEKDAVFCFSVNDRKRAIWPCFLAKSLVFYTGSCFAVSVFSILSSRFSMASSRFSICLRTLPTSSVGTTGNGVGEGHLLSSGLSGLLEGNGDGKTAFFLLLQTYSVPNKIIVNFTNKMSCCFGWKIYKRDLLLVLSLICTSQFLGERPRVEKVISI